MIVWNKLEYRVDHVLLVVSQLPAYDVHDAHVFRHGLSFDGEEKEHDWFLQQGIPDDGQPYQNEQLSIGVHEEEFLKKNIKRWQTNQSCLKRA